MRTIYKYELRETDTQTIKLPHGFMALSVAEQDERLYLWCGVNTENPEYEYRVEIVGTGNPIDSDALRGLTFVGTVQMSSGLVWHVWIKEKN